jgi:lipid A 4'-phosphatase
VFTFLIIWVVHGLIYRWPRTRLSDEAIDRAIERFVKARYRLKKPSVEDRLNDQ